MDEAQPADSDDQISDQIPNDQQEDESDITRPVSFKDAVVVNADWTIETIDLQIKKGNIDLQPDFQRRAAWDDVRKSRLIESIIVAMPVPNVVLAENKDHRGRFIVLDGKQRLVSIHDFMAGRFRLRGLDIRLDLEGKNILDIPEEDKEYLENSTIRSTVIRNWSDQNFLYSIFLRLNSGSLPLSPQELRKALVGGHLLDAIEEYLLTSKSFHLFFGNSLDKRMRDSELVLRFLAFDKGLMGYRGDFKQLLDDTARYFEADWNARKPEAYAEFSRLDKSLDLAFHIFGHDAFKKWLGDKYERVINRAIFDCISRFFAEPAVQHAAVGKVDDIIRAFKEICQEQGFREAVERTTKSVQATNYRIEKWGKTLATCLELRYDEAERRVV